MDTLKLFDNLSRNDVPVSVDTRLAAATLGVSTRTLRRLRRLGILPSFGVESKIHGKRIWRYPFAELCSYINRKRSWVHAYDSHTNELPPIIVAKLLGISLESVYRAKKRGRLKDYGIKSVRHYLLHIGRVSIGGEIRKQFEGQLKKLRAEVRRSRRLLKFHHCECCGNREA